MNKDITLVILAAGMGSRFGGLKQITPLGPNEEFIIDSLEIINDDTYKVTFTHKDGTEEEKKEVTAKFSLNEEGSVIVEEINL